MWVYSDVHQQKSVTEKQLAKIAKKAREQLKISKAELGRRLGVSKGAIHLAEEYADMSLTKLRIRMIEKCSLLKVTGPVFLLESKKDIRFKNS